MAVSRNVPGHWPKWGRICNAIKRDGHQCRSKACVGADKCKKHGGGGPSTGRRAWQRYLLWVLCPEWGRTNVMSPVLDEEVEMVCQIIAEAALMGTVHTSAIVKMHAAEKLLESASLVAHPDPSFLLTHLTREQAEAAIEILYLNGLMKRPPQYREFVVADQSNAAKGIPMAVKPSAYKEAEVSADVIEPVEPEIVSFG